MASKRTENIIIGGVAIIALAIGISKVLEPAPPSTTTAGAMTVDTGHGSTIAAGGISSMNGADGEGFMGSNLTYAARSGYAPPAGHPDMTRDQQIQALKKSDPSSYGYTDDDRAFLREHGVSESQARATEDAQHGQARR